jgi:hypothetical protein
MATRTAIFKWRHTEPVPILSAVRWYQMILGCAEPVTYLELMVHRESLPFCLSWNHFKMFQNEAGDICVEGKGLSASGVRLYQAEAGPCFRSALDNGY